MHINPLHFPDKWPKRCFLIFVAKLRSTRFSVSLLSLLNGVPSLPAKSPSKVTMAYIPNPDDTLYKGPPPYDSDYGQYCHSRDPASHDSQRGYWVAPDGTRHSLTEDQAQQMLAQTPAQQEFLVSKDPLHKDALSPIQSTRRDLMQRPAPQDVPIQAQLDPLDQEMLAEAQGYETHDQSVQDSDKHDDAALDESLSWIPRFEGRLEEARSNVTLAVRGAVLQDITESEH